jgi:hypothetical protein
MEGKRRVLIEGTTQRLPGGNRKTISVTTARPRAEI